jgi:preprotein translocase subunit SecA
MFQDLMNRLDADIVEKLYTVQLAREEDVERLEQKQQQRQAKVTMTHGSEPAAAVAESVKRDQPKVGRNDPCVCGSGKKYKKCCGAAH